MAGDPLNCNLLALRAAGDRSLSHSLAGLNVMWMTARAGCRPERLHHDVYLIAASVPVDLALDFYRHVRAGEPNVPVIIVRADTKDGLFERIASDPSVHLAPAGELTVLRQLVDYVLDGIQGRLMSARIEELKTLVEDLNERHQQLHARSEHWQRRLAGNDWLAMRSRAMQYFAGGGGTLWQFDRLWPGVCAEALGTVRESS